MQFLRASSRTRLRLRSPLGIGSRFDNTIRLSARLANTNCGRDEPSGKRARITLIDGTVLEGTSFGAEKNIAGEVVFSTGMTGYTEALTDPSFQGQILSLTYPMIGNYGVPDMKDIDKYGLNRAFESDKIHATALLCQDYSEAWSHWDAKSSLGDWLKAEGVPGI